MNVDEHEAVLGDQRSIAGNCVVGKRHAVHRACNAGIISIIDFGRRVGIPVKLNAHSEGKPNGIPG